jgi:16S rRNA (guanine527-N7)-methyltransferase
MGLFELLGDVGLDVDREDVAKLERLVDELLRWNRRRNLTAITDRDEILEKHLLDSLTLLPYARRSSRMLDIGSGAGFPALPVKITCPDLEVVSVDAVGKKIDFQRHACRTLGLTKFTALSVRIEDMADNPRYAGGFDLVTARALCSLDQLVVMAEPFLTPSGRLVAMKGSEGDSEIASHYEALSENGWLVKSNHICLPLSAARRCLIELTRKH